MDVALHEQRSCSSHATTDPGGRWRLRSSHAGGGWGAVSLASHAGSGAIATCRRPIRGTSPTGARRSPTESSCGRSAVSPRSMTGAVPAPAAFDGPAAASSASWLLPFGLHGSHPGVGYGARTGRRDPARCGHGGSNRSRGAGRAQCGRVRRGHAQRARGFGRGPAAGRKRDDARPCESPVGAGSTRSGCSVVLGRVSRCCAAAVGQTVA
jgi:hypothetical protein